MKPTAYDLMEMHAEAMFTHDWNMRLCTINEPWSQDTPAPRFFLGRTIDGKTISRFRHDVPESLVEQIEGLCADEPTVTDFGTKPKHFEAYMKLFQTDRFTMGPCYSVPDLTVPTTMQVVSLTQENVNEYARGGFEWLKEEIDCAQPCIALIHEGMTVSVCRSVRIAPRAHEAGLETLDAYRGRGYAAAVVAGWAKAVREMGSLPLYSTFWDNLSSQSVAKKSGLSFYGVNFTVT